MIVIKAEAFSETVEEATDEAQEIANILGVAIAIDWYGQTQLVHPQVRAVQAEEPSRQIQAVQGEEPTL